MPFSGFSPRTIGFLEGLSQNDDRAWFEAHAEDCENDVIGPAKELVLDLGPRLRELDPKIQAIPRVRGSIKAFERRNRFPNRRMPRYKPYLDLWFWAGQRRAWDNSGFFLRLTASRLILAAGMVEFQKATLLRYREQVLDEERGAALAAIVDDLRAAGYFVVGESYKRTPRGVPADHRRAALAKHGGLIVTLDGEHPRELTTPAFVDFAFAHYSRMAALHAWLVALHP